MVQSTPCAVLVAALLINTLTYCSAENVNCVTPTATSCSSCPHYTHCATLSEYAREAELYFTSNTTMVFLPGDHILDRTITVTNVIKLTMRGKSSSGNIATVVRNGSVGLSFTNMVNFNIYSLAFTSYNRSWSDGSQPASSFALFLQSIQNAKLVNCFFHDNLGTALKVYNTNILLADIEFIQNQCQCGPFYEKCQFGCGITAFNSTLTFNGKTTFVKNSASFMYSSGAIWASASSLHFTGTNYFIGNFASNTGGAISATSNTSLSFTGTNAFRHNSGEYGGAIGAAFNTVVTFAGNNKFIGNLANFGGAIFASSNTSFSFSGTSEFSHNSADKDGGAICTYNNTVLTFNGTNNFISNYAYIGGAICTYNNTVLTFNGTNMFSGHSAKYRGGAIYADFEVLLTLFGTSDFSNNSAKANGGAIYVISKVVLVINGFNKFNSNSAHYGGAICAASNILLNLTGVSSFGNNSAIVGGAIFAYSFSKLTFNQSIYFINNGKHINLNNVDEISAGGAVYLTFSSTFSVLPHTTVCWENNHASVGGAILVKNVYPFMIYCIKSATFKVKEKCFFQLPGQNLSTVQLLFKNNYADAAGSVLYGGAIDNCELTDLDTYRSGEVFDLLFHIKDDTNYSTTSKISSVPLHICVCKDNLPDCSGSLHYTVPNLVYPGETFQISVVAVGQRDGAVSSMVRSAAQFNLIDPHPVNLLDYQQLQRTNNTCTKLNYTVLSLSQKVSIGMHPENSPCSSGSLDVRVNLNQTCPLGFNISTSARSCVCEPRLTQYTNQCNITNGVGRITRVSGQQFWVGFNNELILHPQCPFDYCVNETVVFPLNNTDVQCAYNRSGLLCGCCKEGYSLVLGTHRCKKCTNIYLLFLIPFAVMGVVLVLLVLVCKLTVATGTLSGLVFYANIVGANRTMFLPVKSTDALSVFIAWLNLDFSIETCFYDGMNAYSKTWLQFVFPVYIWLLVGLMIVVSHFSHRFANLLGNNPVSVLATLILLSYAKILHTLIVTVYFTHLQYPTYNRKVWLYDANINYINGKHIPLFLVAVLVFLFLFLPYTLLLLFGQWLQAISHLRVFSWVNSARLKPFMDAYHAPYKAKHRYWPGLLLVLRCVLLLVFALNPQQDPNINLLAILLGAGILQLWAWVSGGVYKNWCLDALEGSFALNLIMLVGATYCVKLTEGDQLAVGYTSVSIALVTFIGIISYHIFQQMKHTKLWNKVPKLNLKLNKLNTKQAEDNLNNPNNNPMVANFNQLREPWLEVLLPPTHSDV